METVVGIEPSTTSISMIAVKISTMIQPTWPIARVGSRIGPPPPGYDVMMLCPAGETTVSDRQCRQQRGAAGRSGVGEEAGPAHPLWEKVRPMSVSSPAAAVPKNLVRHSPSRRRDCHCTDTPCLSLLKQLIKVQGGAIK